MKHIFKKSKPIESPASPAIFAAGDTQELLGSLKQLGTGRIICNSGALSAVVSTDFRSIHPQGNHLIFPDGLLELFPKNLQVLVSTASCGLGLGVSLMDQEGKVRIVFHFCHGSPWGKWLAIHVQSGLLQPHTKPHLAPENLCWCDLWPQTEATSFAMPGSLLEKRFSTVTSSRTIEARLHSRDLELTTVVHPSSFDILASSIRFWDRPRTRVCYADLSSIAPEQNESYVALQS